MSGEGMSFDEWFDKEYSNYGYSYKKTYDEKHDLYGSQFVDERYDAYKAGAQSQQAKIDDLQARVDKVAHILTYTNHASTPLCNELRDILKGNKDEN